MLDLHLRQQPPVPDQHDMFEPEPLLKLRDLLGHGLGVRGVACFSVGQVGEVGEGAFAHPLAFAPALAQQDSGSGVPVGDGLDLSRSAG